MIRSIVIAGILFLHSLSCWADLLISAPPIADKQLTEQLISPILNEISVITGIETSYVHHNSWLEYTKHVRLDTYDFLISEAHITAWTLRTGQAGGGLEHQLLRKIDEDQRLFLVSYKPDYTGLSSLYYKTICVKPSPSLDAVLLYRAYNNPISQPIVKELNQSYDEIISLMNGGKCDAAVINQYALDQRDDLNIVHSYKAVPGMTITMSKRLPSDIQNDISTLLANETLSQPIEEVITELAEMPDGKLVIASPEEYRDLDQLLEQVWGW